MGDKSEIEWTDAIATLIRAAAAGLSPAQLRAIAQAARVSSKGAGYKRRRRFYLEPRGRPGMIRRVNNPRTPGKAGRESK